MLRQLDKEESIDKIKELLLKIDNIENILSLCITIGVFAIIILFFLTVFFLTKSTSAAIQTKTLERLDNSKFSHFNSHEIQRRLTAYGAPFMFKNKLTPLTYIFFKFGIALGLFMIGSLITNLIIGLLLGVFGFFLLDIAIKVSNNIDNQRMMNDIKMFCSVLNIQSLSGTSIASALAEGYSVVKHPRLKTSLTELSSKILAHQNFDESVNDFNAQFDNKYIDSCCTILKQSQDSGKSSRLLSSLSNQIVDIQTAIHVKETAMEETKNALINILIFAGFMMIALVALFSEIDLTAIF